MYGYPTCMGYAYPGGYGYNGFGCAWVVIIIFILFFLFIPFGVYGCGCEHKIGCC